MGQKKSYKPPIAVQNAAKRGLKLRRKAKKSNRGGLTSRQAGAQGIGSGVQRAANLASGGNVSLQTVKRMHAFFSRHRKNSKIDPGKTAETDRGFQAWLLWGGDPGAAWAKRIVERERRVEKSQNEGPFEALVKGKVFPVGTVRQHGKVMKRKTAHGWIELPKGRAEKKSDPKKGQTSNSKVKVLGGGKRTKESVTFSGVATGRGLVPENLREKYAKKYAKVLASDMKGKGLNPKVRQVKTEEVNETHVEFAGAYAVVDFDGSVRLPVEQAATLKKEDADIAAKFVDAKKEYEADPEKKRVDKELDGEMSGLEAAAKEVSVEKAKDLKKTPAKPHERKKGSKKNEPGSARHTRGGIVLSATVIESLKKKVKDHNERSSKRVTLGQLKAVYRRGSGAFSTSHHPKANRHSWSMGRVNSFLRRVKGGKGHSQDDDLIKKAGPFIGPRGGKWADPEHTKPYKEGAGERTGLIKVDEKQVRELADRLFERVPDMGPFQKQNAIKQGKAISVTKTKVAGADGSSSSVFVKMMFDPRPEGKRDKDGVSGSNRTEVDEDGNVEKKSITLYLDPDLPHDKAKAEIRSVLAHELAHAADPSVQQEAQKRARAGARGERKNTEDGVHAYLNDPQEVSATMVQISRELKDPKFVKKMMDSKMSPSDALKETSEWKQKGEYYTDKNKKRILKMVARVRERIADGSIKPVEKSGRVEQGGAVFHSLLKRIIEGLEKGRRPDPPGTVKVRKDGRKYTKLASGEWRLVSEEKRKRGRKKGTKAKPHYKKPGPKVKSKNEDEITSRNNDLFRLGKIVSVTEGAKLLGLSTEKFREYALEKKKIPADIREKALAHLKRAKAAEKKAERGAEGQERFDSKTQRKPMKEDPQSDRPGLRWFKRSKGVFSSMVKAAPPGPGWEKIPHPRTGKMGFRRKKAGGGYEYYYPESEARAAAKKIKDSGLRSRFKRPSKAKEDMAGSKFKGTPKNREQVLLKYGHLGVVDPPPEGANFKKIQFQDFGLENHADTYCYKWKDMTRGKKDPKTGKPKGKWKYGYSTEYKRNSGREKFDRIVSVLGVLEEARSSFSDDTGNKKLSDKDRSTACALALMAMTGIRKGGMEHFKENGTRGSLTIAAKNVKIKGDVVSLDFVGKKNQQNIVTLENKNVAQYMKQKMKGKSGDDMLWPEVKEKDLEVMKRKHGFEKSIKNHDFRTANATLYAAEAFAALQGPPPPLPKGDKKQTKLLLSKITEVSTIVSDKLNNSPSAAEESYIHPAVIYGWLTTAVGEEKARTFFGKAKGMEGLTKNKKAALILEKMMSLKMPGKRSWGWTKEDEDIIQPEQMDSYLLPESLL